MKNRFPNGIAARVALAGAALFTLFPGAATAHAQRRERHRQL